MEISEVWTTVAELSSPELAENVYHQSPLHSAGIAPNTSITMSPFSLSAAIMMLMLGARGRTESQLSSVIFKRNEKFTGEKFGFYKSLTNLIPNSQTGTELKISNQLFTNSMFSLNDTIKEQASKFFNADVTKEKFCTRRALNSVNTWISKKTLHNVNHILSKKRIHGRTAAVFVNTVTFKGDWTEEFKPIHTFQQDFFVTKTDKIPMTMMNTIQRVRYGQLKTSEVLVIPLKGKRFNLVLLLPEDMTELPAFEKMLSIDLVRNLNSSLEDRIVDITIPEIEIREKLNLMEYLPKRGVTEIFNQTSADFKNLFKDRTNRIYVSDAEHRVVVKFKKNTKAGKQHKKSFKNPHKKFIANRPFIFYLLDTKTGLIVFMGRFTGRA